MNALMEPRRTAEYTPNGLKIEGPYENRRNTDNATLYKSIIREAYNLGADGDVIIAHHLTYVASDVVDGYDFEIVEEIPSADTLIFDHDVAKKIWGKDWERNLVRLALTPTEKRDALLGELYYNRPPAFSENRDNPSSVEVYDTRPMVD